MSLQSDSALDSSSSEQLIKNIQGEIGREKNINDIQHESQEFFFSAMKGKNVNSLLDSLKKAQERIEKWRSQGGIERRLESIKESTSNMGLSDKESLGDLYKIQAQLKEITNNLLKKLKDTNPSSEINIGQIPFGRSEYSLEKVQKALEWMDWDKGELKFRVKYLNNDRTAIFIQGDKKEFSYGWGSWENNPFRIFFESRDLYEMSMNRVIEAEKNLQRLSDGESMMNIVKDNLDDSVMQTKNDYEKRFKMAVEEAKLDFEMQVTSKLIEWILPKEQQRSN